MLVFRFSGVYRIKPSDSNMELNKKSPHEQSLYLENGLRHRHGPSKANAGPGKSIHPLNQLARRTSRYDFGMPFVILKGSLSVLLKKFFNSKALKTKFIILEHSYAFHFHIILAHFNIFTNTRIYYLNE